MNEKIISTILVACASLTALFFVVKNNWEAAIAALTIMFTLTNFSRSRRFKEQGYEKEAKWMKTMSIIFAILSVLTLYVVFAG